MRGRVRSFRAPAKLGILLFLILLLTGSSHLTAQQTVDVEGRVAVERGQSAVAGATVRLENAEGMMIQQAFTSSSGQFSFSGLRKIAYRLEITAEGFQPYQQDLDLGVTAGTVVLSISLVPLGERKAQTAVGSALTDETAPKKARKEFEKGERALAAKNPEEARGHFEKAVTEYPCYARAQTSLAAALTALKDYSAAKNALRKAIECDPGFPDSSLLLGQMLNVERNFAESEKVLQEGVRLSPGAWQFYFEMGVTHFGLGQYAKAQEDYSKVLSLNSTPPAEFHVKFADLYVREGAYDKAYSEMDAYLHAEPNGRFAPKIRDIMRQMEAAGVLHPAQAKATTTTATKP